MHRPADIGAMPLGNTRAAIEQLAGEPLGPATRSLVELAAPQPGETVVDLGCHELVDGFRAMRRVGAAGRVRGFVESSADHEHATALRDRWVFADLAYRHARLEAVPLDDAVADIVLVDGSLERSGEPLRILEEACRLLAAQGRLVLGVTRDKATRLASLLDAMGLRASTTCDLAPGRIAIVAIKH